METKKITIITPQEGYDIVAREDYEREMSLENQALPEEEQYKAHRAKEVCLPESVDVDNYIEITSKIETDFGIL